MQLTSEQKAIELGNDPKRLKARLLAAKDCLTDSNRKLFKDAMFDFPHKRLIGHDRLTLQWRIRDNPNMPEGYHNQQTNQGTVVCIALEG
jgi:hypothetical protein